MFSCTLSTSVAQASGGMDAMMGHDHKDKDTLALIQYTAEEDRLARLLENQQLIKTPIVRGGRRYTISPYGLVWDNDHYYLVGWSDDHSCVVQFRVDRMKNVSA